MTVRFLPAPRPRIDIKMDPTVLDPVWDVLPLIISIMVLAVVFGAIGGLFSKLKF